MTGSTGTQTNSKRPPLPRELISLIASHVTDTTTILNLIRTCHFASSAAEHRLWETLNLSLPLHYGEAPDVPPFLPDGTAEYRVWEVEEAGRLDGDRRAALKAKIQTILNRGSEKKWEKVVGVKLDSQLGSWGMMTILETVSSTITTLEFVKPTILPLDHNAPSKSYDTLEMKLITCDFHFPSLTSIHLHRGSIRDYDFLPVLTDAAPNLTTMAIDVAQHRRQRPDILPMPFTDWHDTNIRKIRISFGDMSGADNNAVTAITWLLKHSPRLTQLSIAHCTPPSLRTVDQLSAALKDHQELLDLQWSLSPESLRRTVDRNPGGFRSLVRLVVECQSSLEVMSALNLSKHPHLRSLWFEIPPSGDAEVVNWNHAAFPLTEDSAIPDIIELFRRGCSLQNLRYTYRPEVYGDIWGRLDAMDDKTNATATVASYDRGSKELLNVRILARTSDSGSSPVEYVRRDLYDGRILFDKRYQTQWREWAMYRREMIPLRVLARMREKQGVSWAVWRNRGVEVSLAAWGMLAQWCVDQIANGPLDGDERSLAKAIASQPIDVESDDD